MKNINILSLVQAYRSLNKESYDNFLNYYGIKIKNEEVEDLNSLVNILYDQSSNANIFNRFYVGYNIPQIGKEFDLLRFGEERIINIELKSTSSEEKIKKQLRRNKYYLSYLGKEVYNLSFVSYIGKLFFLNNSDEIENVDISFLYNLLRDQKTHDIYNVDDLFNPSDYLVSPFNSTDKFIRNRYFLTLQQEEVKTKILKKIKDGKAANFISVTGSAGTGKTLLIYDIAKQIRWNNNKILIIHCGYLNEGQNTLIECGWEIISIKEGANRELSSYDMVFIDEAQRIYPSQLIKIVEKIELTGGNCIFSYDKVQTLSATEERRDIDSKINDIGSITRFKLSEKIRTNKEIAIFIKLLFNCKRNLELKRKGNIELNYFKHIDTAKEFLGSLDTCEWEIIRFTPSQYDKEHHEKYSDFSSQTSHRVIGQEFDNVVVVIDEFFSYQKGGKLIYMGGAYYHPVKMLFQNITRTRKKLNLVIIGNDKILDRCLSILKD